MTEKRAVLLAFASVAFVLPAATALFIRNFAEALAGPPPKAVERQAVNEIFNSKTSTFDPVRGLDRLLPAGLGWSKAATLLASSKFHCKASEAGETCTHEARMGPCRFARRIDVGLGRDRQIISITALETPNCL